LFSFKIRLLLFLGLIICFLSLHMFITPLNLGVKNIFYYLFFNIDFGFIHIIAPSLRLH